MIGDVAAAAVRSVNACAGAIPAYGGRFQNEGLGLEQPDNAEILRDDHGMPTVVAATAADVFALHGVCVGQDRLWQVHSMRLAACGRLAEVSAKALKFACFARQIGFHRKGAEDWEHLQATAEYADAVAMVESFVRGVNWSASQRRAHGENFLLTGSKWEPLQSEELCAMMRLVAFGMSSGWQHALVRQWFRETFGAEEGAAWTDTCEGDGPPHSPFTADPAMSAAFQKLRPADLAWASGPDELPKGQGSNWVVVDGKHTTSGKPMLANDPHLKVTLGGFWYPVTYRGACNAAGLACATLPGVIIGHNGRCAWGVTLGYTDVEDLYLERFRSDDGRYEHRGAWHEPLVTTEEVRVKGAARPHTLRVVSTCHGPLLEDTLSRLEGMASDVSASAHAGQSDDSYVYKLAYAGLPMRRQSTAFVGIRRLLQATDFASFDAALAFASGTIALNFAFASAEGHIGYVLCGEVPLGRGRRGDNSTGGDEWLPLCGWSGEFDYDGFVSHAQLPKAFDPPDAAFIVSANHRVVDYDFYPYWLGNVYKSGYRAKRIHALLESALAGGGAVSLQTLRATQLDQTSVAAREFAEVVAEARVSLASLGSDDAHLAEAALHTLRGWDGALGAESTAAAVYQVMHATLVKRLLAGGIDARTRTRPSARPLPDALQAADPLGVSGGALETIVQGCASDNIFKQVNELHGHLHRNVLRQLRESLAGHEAASWWVAQAGGFHHVVCSAAAAAERQLAGLADRTWGAMHLTHIAHPLTAALGFRPGSFLDVGPSQPTGGDTNSPCQTSTKSLDDLSASATHVSARVLFDTADLAHSSRIITPTGVCEVAGSEHRSDDTRKWHEGGYRKLRWEMGEIRDNAKYITTFTASTSSTNDGRAVTVGVAPPRMLI